jgi:hypothetical protein
MTQPSPYFIRRTAPLEDMDPNDNRIHFFEEDEGRIDFHQYWRTIRKHLPLIVAICVGVTLIRTIRVLIETPLYTASATMLIKPGTPQIFGNQVQQDNSNTDQYDYYETFNKTQYEILKSRSLAISAIKYKPGEAASREARGQARLVRLDQTGNRTVDSWQWRKIRGKEARIDALGYGTGGRKSCGCRRVHERSPGTAGARYEPGQN